MLFAFSIAPSGGTGSADGDGSGDGSDGGVSAAVAEAVRVVRESGLPNETTSMFTTIESETWDEGMAVVKQAVEAVTAVAPRVSLVLKADIRPGYTGQLSAKVDRVEERLRGDDGA
ncbi:thiamine-binding protein [Pseudonocardia phyllosphaerae]|uniref:thiamine-binding protein n=1 Tax=Pseudonocardia phyllosphaerae TaxID=3390502 RepID=UPI00397C0904